MPRPDTRLKISLRPETRAALAVEAQRVTAELARLGTRVIVSPSEVAAGVLDKWSERNTGR